MSVLHLYTSSAGSGKTFHLTANYLNLLFNTNISHRSILAVTFTNKASAEMKSRIIETLYVLSKGDESASLLASKLFAGKRYDETQIFRKASALLDLILNDYSAFYVNTIDKFFQWIIRSFARESGLQSGYNIELNNRLILSEAIDLMMFSLDKDDKLRNWLVKFAGEKISSGKDWNFRNDLETLGAEIFKEQYQEITGGIKAARKQKDKIEIYQDMLSREVFRFENHLSEIARKALKSIEEAGFSQDDFAYKERGIAGYFIRMAGGKDFNPGLRAREALADPDKWVTKDHSHKEKVLALVHGQLNSLLESAINYYDKYIIHYNTSVTILKNLFSFGILTDIYLNVREITNEKNLFLLSDGTVFLKKIIANNEAPFIYEKAGNNFNHFMLDEFQDTSRYQWHNFHPLIVNGLATGNESLIVGDVKQAIYRWRNSDWRILATEVYDDFSGFNKQLHPLDTNWRSQKNIVTFNNSLFYASTSLIETKMDENTSGIKQDEKFMKEWKDIIRTVYINSLQKISPEKQNTEGYVELSFCSMKKEDYLEMLSQKLPELIIDIISRGYNPGDITILVRKADQGNDVANILMNHVHERPEEERFNIISNDSLFIKNHPAVQFLIALLKYFRDPSDLLNIAFIRHEFLRYLGNSNIPDDMLSKIFSNCERGITPEWHKCFEDFTVISDTLKKLPLFELTEELIRLFELNRSAGNIAYIQAFQDIVLDFVRTLAADISSFLSWWELHGASQTLSISEAQDAIKIMTIHKSKGLEFPVVIIPFCDWNLDIETKKDNYIWCRNYHDPFNFIEYVPVNYSSRLVNTHFQNDYFDEKFRNYVDNLNLLYVAFTRPEKELYIFANPEKKDATGELLFNIIQKGSQATPTNAAYPHINLSSSYQNEQNRLIFGIKGKPRKEAEIKMPEYLKEYQVIPGRERLILNVKNAWLRRTEYDFGEKVGYGTVMHEILSEIETSSDIDIAVKKAVRQGKIPENDQHDVVILLSNRINTPVVREWFDGSWKLMREREIGSQGKRIYRPDRVMIKNNKLILVDFKFGDEILKGHEKQVLHYIELLNNMGYNEVKGFLWYFSPEKIIELP